MENGSGFAEISEIKEGLSRLQAQRHKLEILSIENFSSKVPILVVFINPTCVM